MNNNILIIDDEEIVCKGLELMLKKEGYQIEWVLNGGDGIKKMEENSYQTALIDYVLPDIDGLEICKVMKKINPEIKPILMTGYYGLFEEKQDQVKNLKYIYKPFEKHEIIELIKSN
ncbi:response regulator [Candidatus Omnitrophota bacterium]